MLTREQVEQAIKTLRGPPYNSAKRCVLTWEEFDALVHYLHKAESDLEEAINDLREMERRANEYDY